MMSSILRSAGPRGKGGFGDLYRAVNIGDMLKTGVNGKSATGRWDSIARLSAGGVGLLQTAHKALIILKQGQMVSQQLAAGIQ